MKPAPFDYVAPTSLEEVLAHLTAAGGEAKILAGGQSLVPAMNFRLSRPTSLVDINNVTELSTVVANGASVTIGSLVRHAELERNTLGGTLGALLAEVARWVGHVPVRTRGTIGGSLAHADPAAEWGVLAVALEARVEVAGPNGRREVTADEFFRSVFVTSLEPDEVITGLRLPRLGSNVRFGFREFSRRAGDFALVAVLAVVSLADDGRVESARIGLGGVGSTPLRAREAEDLLSRGGVPNEATLRSAAEAAADGVEPPADIHASSDFRRKLVRNLTFESLGRATVLG